MTAPKGRKSSPRLQKLYCDRIWAALIKAPQRCARCGNTDGPFEAAHIVRRRFAHTRSDELNGWCLDSKCHGIVDGNASAFMDLVEQTIGRDALGALEAKSQLRTKKDWYSEHDRLKALVKARTP